MVYIDSVVLLFSRRWDMQSLSFGQRCGVNRVSWVWLAPLLLVWAGCVHLVAYYDAVTYKGLTDLKAETMLFLENIDGGRSYSDYASKFEDLRLQIEKVYEYEKGKRLNDDTIAQVGEIRGMLQEMIKRYQEQNQLGAFYLQEKGQQLETAFDLAITTENLKMKRNN
jgi:hypothetical protein